jgi:sugar PTS system EIIA component
MSILDFLKKKDESVSDDSIVAIANGELFDVSTVSDPMFAEQMMGKSIAFKFDEDTVTLCSPVNGTLSVLFPTGHAFGVRMNNGVELLIHCGINTVDAKGKGFKLLKKKQGDTVLAGDPIVKVDLKELSSKYDMSTMLIITNDNGKNIEFINYGKVTKGQSIIK